MNVVPFKMTIEGQEIDAYLTEKNWELVLKAINKNKKTGYERPGENEQYWYINNDSDVKCTLNTCNIDNKYYTTANCYTSKEVAENNARADKLMHQLRRVAVEHRKNNNPTERFYIYYLKTAGILQLRRDSDSRYIGPWFDSLQSGAQAIETFKDELIWYFTEYRDSL